jgi:hypothetical protein
MPFTSLHHEPRDDVGRVRNSLLLTKICTMTRLTMAHQACRRKAHVESWPVAMPFTSLHHEPRDDVGRVRNSLQLTKICTMTCLTSITESCRQFM